MSPGAAETILVVEDDPDLRGLVSRELADGGHRVRAVGSAEEAMDVEGVEDLGEESVVEGGDIGGADDGAEGRHDGRAFEGHVRPSPPPRVPEPARAFPPS